MALCFFAAVIFATGRTFGVDAGRDEVSAREHYQREKERALRACAGSEGGATAECIAKAIESAQSQSESRQDLYAQQDMARWAFWMLITSVGTIIITALGVWFVKRTLDATLRAVEDTSQGTGAMREANIIAGKAASISEDTARRQLRAYMIVQRFQLSEIKSGMIPAMSFEVKNVGQTPAYEVRLAYQINFDPADGTRFDECKVRFDNSLEIGYRRGRAGQRLRPHIRGSDYGARGRPYPGGGGRTRVGVFGLVSYRDAFKRRRLVTFKKFLEPKWLGDEGVVNLLSCAKGNSAN